MEAAATFCGYSSTIAFGRLALPAASPQFRGSAMAERCWRLQKGMQIKLVARSCICRSELHLDDDPPLPKFEQGKLLSELSTWGIGGAAKLFVEAHDEHEMVSCIRYCTRKKIKFMVVGKGSNCLFDDKGFDGCIVLNRIDDWYHHDGNGLYHVGSGYPFNILGLNTAKHGYGGLEFAAGIPGTVGGAVYMNAGADGQETADVLQAVDFLDVNGVKQSVSRDKGRLVGFGYRTSPFHEMLGFGAIVSATFQLHPCTKARQRQRDYLMKRKQTQPLTDRSAGCVFRNPSPSRDNCCSSAAELIDKAGLKGATIGGAQVSQLHANFIVNLGKATAADVSLLISLVKTTVQAQFRVQLAEEVRRIPY